MLFRGDFFNGKAISAEDTAIKYGIYF